MSEIAAEYNEGRPFYLEISIFNIFKFILIAWDIYYSS